MQSLFNNEVAIRRSRALRCLTIGAAVLTIAGCATSPPTPLEIDNRYKDNQRDIEDVKKDLDDACEAAFVIAAPPTTVEECKQQVLAWYMEAKQKAVAAKQAAYDQRWNDAYRAKEEYDKFIRKSIEDLNLPGILRDIIKKQFPLAKISADWHGDLAACSSAGQECYQTLTLTGPTEISANGASDTSVMKIIIDAKGTFSAAVVDALPFSGTLKLTSSTGGEVTAVLVDNPENRLHFDASGNGSLIALFDVSYSALGWNAVLPRHTFLGIKLTRDSAGGVHCVAVEAATSAVFLSTPWSITDYNRDGVRDFISDYNAFLVGLAQHSPRADMNGDGVWDSLDDTEWQNMFAEDTN